MVLQPEEAVAVDEGALLGRRRQSRAEHGGDAVGPVVPRVFQVAAQELERGDAR